ncbi:MAG: hypothetical protein Q9161_000912 [Pseudevernia consocians]
MMFKHAGKSGAKIFDGVKVKTIDIVPDSEASDLGRPVSAAWSRKNSSSGATNFEHLVDATGQAGLVSTTYLKNRQYISGLKTSQAGAIGKGLVITDTRRGPAIFRGVRRREWLGLEYSLTQCRDFYLESLKLTTGIMKLLSEAELVLDIKAGGDWSYSASTYASPFVRIVGDLGCFIDPFFSSGVHLALSSDLSAAVTICAAKKGGLNDKAAVQWRSKKVAEGYTRFLLVSDMDEEGFDRAFAFFRPIIQGTADLSTNITQDELSKTADFSFKTFQPAPAEQREAVLETLKAISTKAPAQPTRRQITVIFNQIRGLPCLLLSIRDAISRNGKICSVYALYASRFFDATDPRDKIYAFTGHCICDLHFAQPDYSKDVLDVYRETALAILFSQDLKICADSCLNYMKIL